MIDQLKKTTNILECDSISESAYYTMQRGIKIKVHFRKHQTAESYVYLGCNLAGVFIQKEEDVVEFLSYNSIHSITIPLN